MDVRLFARALVRLDDYITLDADFDGNEPAVAEFIKLLEYAAIIELRDDETLPVVVLRNMRELSKDVARKIVAIRNDEPFCTMALSQELHVYRSYRKISKL